jgi:hypothetical protein
MCWATPTTRRRKRRGFTSLYRKQLTQRFAAWRRLIDFIQNPSTVRANTCFLSFHAVDNQPGNAAATVR